MKNIITIGGSSSKNSINKQLSEYVGTSMEGVKVTILDLNDYALTVYSGDIENEHGLSKELL